MWLPGTVAAELAHGSPAEPELAALSDCQYDQLTGREFEFNTADPVLRPYGFVLWKSQASIVAEPLPYAEYAGRRGKLTGRKVQAHGLNWYEAVMEDCRPVFAEDASGHSVYEGIRHLEFNGKVAFIDMLAAGHQLVGSEVIVLGDGLEPRQRLYTEERDRWHPLRDGQRLTVVGVDRHRYAHAKGVGPFFLDVVDARGGRGKIKFNPQYLTTPDGPLVTVAAPASATAVAALSPLTPEPATPGASTAAPPGVAALPSATALAAALPYARVPAMPAFAAGTAAPESLLPKEFVLNVAAMDIELNALSAAADLREAGYAAEVSAQDAGSKQLYRIQIAGFASVDAALAAGDELAQRYGWRDSWVIPR